MVKKIVLIFVLLNLILNVFGNNWGLPSRWHSDEKVATALHMLHERSFVDKREYFFQPTGHQIILAVCIIPYITFLKLTGFPLNELKQAASVSWVYMAKHFPDFASGIYIYARSLSAILGAFTVFLIFLIADKVYGRRAAIFSASFLSVCMGFVAVNHFAKYSALVNFLMVLTLLTCIITLEKKAIGEAKKTFYLAVFLVGMTVSVKFNAIFLFPPLLFTYIFAFINFKKDRNIIGKVKNSLSDISASVFLFIIGFLILTPSFTIHFKDYLYRAGTIFSGYTSETSQPAIPVYINTVNYLFELALTMGVPLLVLAIGTAIARVLSPKNITKKEIVLFSFIIPYWLVVTVILKEVYPESKIIIGMVPMLTILAGKAMSDIFGFKRISYAFKTPLFLIVFLYSLAYTFYADLVFLKGDTRYASTKWIKENITPGSKIEIFSQLHLVCADSILDDYEILYLGKSSKDFVAGNLPRWIDIEDRAQYLERLNKNGSASDYIILNLDYMEKLDTNAYLGYLPGLADYVKGLFEGRDSFILVKVFAPKNKKVVLKKMGNLIVPEDILWNPIPDYEAVSPTIYIFKRVKG